MRREELIFVGTCDIAGHVRGKAFPASEIEERRHRGVGWTHTNIMQSAFGPAFDTPLGTAGDLMIVPDPAAEVRVDFGDDSPPEHFFLGDIRQTDGAPWECCPRQFLRRAVNALEDAAGLSLVAAFEQEFVYTGVEDRPGHGYSLGAFRRQGMFGEVFMAALRAAGAEPDSFLPEYGDRQFEVTVAPAAALVAADRAVTTREMARAAAHRLGHRAIFSPMPEAGGMGNGVHIHLSLRDDAGSPVMLEPDGRLGLSEPARQFCAGVLHHLPAIAAITAPSPVSYLRLIPDRWAPTAIDIAQQDRGAALRICPVFAAQLAGRDRTANPCRVPGQRRVGLPAHGAWRCLVRRRRRPAPFAAAAGSGRTGQAAAAVFVRGAGWHGAERGGAELVRSGLSGRVSASQARRASVSRRAG